MVPEVVSVTLGVTHMETVVLISIRHVQVM